MGGCVIVYLNDILFYSDDSEKHPDNVHEVLSHLQKNGLYEAPDKCSFHASTVEYLGFILSPEDLSMDPRRLEKMLFMKCWKIAGALTSLKGMTNHSNDL
jgi:hypothetical protein